MRIPPNILTTFLVFGLTATSQAQVTTTWTGSNSSAVNVNGNWSAGQPGRPDTALFDDPSLVSNQPHLPAGMANNRLQVNSIVFNNAGWNITSDVDPGNPKIQMWNAGAQITSNGAGTNQIARLSTNASNIPVTTGAGNTLIVHDSAGEYLKITEKLGPGTFILGGNITGMPIINNTGTLEGSFIFNGLSLANIFSDNKTIGTGALLGGVGTVTDTNGITFDFNSGSTLAPGDVGIGNSSAGTFTFNNDVVKSRANHFNLNTGSTLAIDLFADGTSDMLSIGSTGLADTYHFNIDTGVTLALTGATTNTTYTIAQINQYGNFAPGNVFDTVTLNGFAINPSEVLLSYNTHNAGDPGFGSIQVTIIPEPQTLLLTALTGLAVFLLHFRRRRT